MRCARASASARVFLRHLRRRECLSRRAFDDITGSMRHAILFVCLGNICRSPTAEAVFRKIARDAGLDVAVDSAGTGDWHVGEAPHPPMVAAAWARGYDLAGLRARQIERADVNRFTHVFAMDRKNLADIRQIRRAGTEPELFLSLVPEAGRDEVPDPYYTGTYDLTIDLCEAASRRLVDRLLSQ